MDDDLDLLARAASDANKRLLKYVRRVRSGKVRPDPGRIDYLVHQCEATFAAWKAAHPEFTVH